MKQITLYLLVTFFLVSGDSIYLARNNNYIGFSRESDNSVDFYDRNNRPAGSYDKNTNTIFDRINRPSINIYDLNRK